VLAGNPVPDTLFIFIDESGNFDFSHKGTRHFVMAGIIALAPLQTAVALHAVRYHVLAQGHDLRQFHASEDRQWVRDAVFDSMRHMRDTQAHVVHGDKSQMPTQLQSDTALHSMFGGSLVEFAIRAHSSDEYRQTVVIFDQALTRSKQGVFHAAVKPRLKALGKPYRLFFQPMIADMNGQLADYVAWSKFVQLERSEERPWLAVTDALQISHVAADW